MLFRYINLRIYANNQNKFIAKTKVTSMLHKNNIDMIYIHIVID